MSSIQQRLKELASVDLFKDAISPDPFVGRPFYFDFNAMKVLSNDHWKEKVAGIPAGAFLIASFDNDKDHPELILLRVLGPTTLPSDSDVVAAMVDHYKERADGEASTAHLDSYTRYEFQFSGLECRVLGSFYRAEDGKTCLGADVDNFYGPNNYSVYKPSGKVLEYIVNFREGSGIPGGPGDQRIGEVRYASSRRHHQGVSVPVYVSAFDYLGKRTALFGMTRTGKSNTVKKIIQATVDLSRTAKAQETDSLQRIGQIIFDVNGEYANINLQDEGTAIFDLYREDTLRYSTHSKKGFRELKANFFTDLQVGFELTRNDPRVAEDNTRFVTNFRSVNLEEPAPDDNPATKRWERRRAVYLACLYEAGFAPPKGFQVRFSANKEVRNAVGLSFTAGRAGYLDLSIENASAWWQKFWEIYDQDPDGCFAAYQRDHDGRKWADDDLLALLTMLTRRSRSGGNPDCSGFRILREIAAKHTDTIQTSFQDDILEQLRAGRIIIIDLSLGDDSTKRFFSERVCRHIFNDAMRRFTQAEPNNYIQFYFEEAHNLFPKKEEKDLSQIYNRLAKEGAKLNLGLFYATQEVSSLSANVLKNTQNWFVSHLNNNDELREIAKYYDFEDFIDSLRRTTDQGFIRMKTYSNAFIVPVQIDRFAAAKEL